MDSDIKTIISNFANLGRITMPDYNIVEKAGERYLVIFVGKVNDIYTKNLEAVRAELSETNEFKNNIYLKEKKPNVWLNSLEVRLLQNILAESLTIGRSSLDSDFFKKFIPFVGGEEQRIYSRTNNIVFGRRGAGKSSLILYACNLAKRDKLPFAWIAMQQYQHRSDLQVIPQFLYEVTDQCLNIHGMDKTRGNRLKKLIAKMEAKGAGLTKVDIDSTMPLFARDFIPFVTTSRAFYLFIDDLHLLSANLQPYFLSSIYSFARGNSIFLKIAAIENLTYLYDEQHRLGLQPPGDAQIIRLDYNLVNPSAAYDHIEQILSAYVTYVGIPSLAVISSEEVLRRLIWVSAGVPRDALYIFNNSIMKAITARRKAVAVTDVNMSAADSMTEKERYISDDIQENVSIVRQIIEDVKHFCINEIKQNAFLVHIDSGDNRYRLIKKIIDLRLIHMIHPGITPERAGEKYEALLLDYAFYTGFRRTRSVKEYNTTLTMPSAQTLRKLKRYDYKSRILVD